MLNITCNDFNDVLWNEGFFTEIHSEMYHSNSFNSEKLFHIFKNEAEKRNYVLSDVDDFDYDKTFWNNYKSDDDKSL